MDLLTAIGISVALEVASKFMPEKSTSKEALHVSSITIAFLSAYKFAYKVLYQVKEVM